ncbi:MAG: DUF4124 domain-containing protein [Gammaproteobacteria bacterium]
MSKPLLALTLCILSAFAQAAVYKWVDANGQTQYSDEPHPGAEEIRDLEVQTYEAPPPLPRAPAEKPKKVKDKFTGYQAVTIVSPSPEETIWENQGNVPVRISVAPAVRVDLGHRLVLLLDGKDTGGGGDAFTLGNIERGVHTVQAKVVDADGGELASSDSVVFHLKRHTALLP